MKDYGRQLVLAHVGISSTAIAPDGWPWGDRTKYLVEDWGGTWWHTLTHQQKWVRVWSRFTIHCGTWKTYIGLFEILEVLSNARG